MKSSSNGDQTASATPGIIELHSSRGRVALFAAVGASAMAMLDGTIVNLALPHIGKTFSSKGEGLQWVLTAYLLTLASFILLGGALGDRCGRKKVFVVGTIWFAAASLLCGLAPTLQLLILGRMLQGIGGALLTPGSLALIQASFRSSDRAAAVGAWSGLGGIAAVIGPFLGGWIVGGPGWRWAFLLNVPVAIAVVLASSSLPESKEEDSARKFDLVGTALVVIALASMTWGFNRAGAKGWSSSLVVGAFVIAILAGIAFVVQELRTKNPLVPPSLFSSRPFTVLNVATFALYAALGALFFLMAYQLQESVGWSALKAGTALLPATIILLLFSARSGALAAKIGPRTQMVVGPLIAALGLFLLSRIGTSTKWLTDVFPGSVLFGIGLVTFVAPLTATIMGSVDENKVSIASGVNNAVARTASLSALAIIPIVSNLTAAEEPKQITAAFSNAMLITVGLVIFGSLVSFFGLNKTDSSTSL